MNLEENVFYYLRITPLSYTYFQWTEDRQGLKPNTWLLILDPEVTKILKHIMISLYYDYISLLFNFLRNFRVKYQESSIGFENLAHLQSMENKCKQVSKNLSILSCNTPPQSFQRREKKWKERRKLSLPHYQVIPGHGNSQKRWTMFGGYLFKYCFVKYQTFHQVCEKACQ